jgi:hypothetical protein
LRDEKIARSMQELSQTEQFFQLAYAHTAEKRAPKSVFVTNNGFGNVWRAEKMALLVMMFIGDGPFFHLATTYVCGVLLSSYDLKYI